MTTNADNLQVFAFCLYMSESSLLGNASFCKENGKQICVAAYRYSCIMLLHHNLTSYPNKAEEQRRLSNWSPTHGRVVWIR